jgi:hypothetical protein
MGDDLDHDDDGAAYDDIDDDFDSAAGDKVDEDGDEVDNNGNGAKLSSPSMPRHLRRCRDGVVTLVVMASLPSPKRRRLAVVDDDGDGMTGDNYEGRNGLRRRCDGVVALVTMASYDHRASVSLPATLPPSCRRRRQAAAAKLPPPPDTLRHRVVASRRESITAKRGINWWRFENNWNRNWNQGEVTVMVYQK